MATVAVVGARDFPHEEMVRKWIRENCHKFDKLVTGDARGVDSWAIDEWRDARPDKPIKSYKADWDRYGRGAGMIRNLHIVNDAHFIVAFWAPDKKKPGSTHSNGTMDDLGLVIAAGKPMNLYYRAG